MGRKFSTPVFCAILPSLLVACNSVLALPLDAAGWTVINPSADSRIVYVSSSQGDDANDGLSEIASVATLNRGQSLLRDGFPDWLLLKKGDVWTDESFHDWRLSGRNEQERMVLGAYGSGARPLVQPAVGRSAWSSVGSSHVAIMGIHFYASRRDPNHPDYVSNASGGSIQYRTADGPQQANLLIEDVMFAMADGTSSIQGNRFEPLRNFELRRSVIVDAYASTGHASGIFLIAVDGVLIEESVFDHNGWYGDRDTGGAAGSSGQATVFNHNIYFAAGNPENVNLTQQTDKIIVRGNIISRASMNGIQFRAGGTVDGNLFVRNPSALGAGGGPDAAQAQPNGVDVLVHNNVFLEGNDLNATSPKGKPVDISNVHHGLFSDNLAAHSRTNGGGYFRGINPNWSVSLLRNVGYDWQYATPNSELGPAVTTEEDNAWWDSARTNWPISGSNRRGEDVTFIDPTRTAGSYNAMLGGENSFEGFIAEARQQSKDYWRPEYTAKAANAWIRAGYREEGEAPPKGDVLVNDTDADGDPIWVFTVNGDTDNVGRPVSGRHGIFRINQDGQWFYEFTGEKLAVAQQDQVSYRCTDGEDPSNETTVTVTIPALPPPPNTPPVANPDASILEGDP